MRNNANPVYGYAGFRGRIAEAAGGGRARYLRRIHAAGQAAESKQGHIFACKGICPVMRPECLPTGENAGWNSAGACKNAGAGADCGGGLWTHSSPGYSGGAASWLRQCARLAAAEISGRGAHQLGHAQRRCRDRRFHYVYGGGTGRR